MTSTCVQPKTVAILGGSFDPVHLGHIAVADCVNTHLRPDEVRFMPCKIPPHKRGFFSREEDRLAMLALALRDRPFTIEMFELEQKATSYSVQSMRALRARENAGTTLLFVVGYDSLCNIHTWWHWQDLFDLVNLVVVGRPGVKAPHLNKDVAASLAERACRVDELSQFRCGKIVVLPSSEKHISSSALRRKFAHQDPNVSTAFVAELDASVAAYIKQHRLYEKAMQV